MNQAPTRVAILGGGCGGIAAAFWLTSTPALRQRYAVTVYTRGWRLGGKGASGRNADSGARIEEHGLHMWMGCYENAFRTIRACYDEWRPANACPFRKWTDAFSPQTTVTFTQRQASDSAGWDLWHFALPARAGTPGDGTGLRCFDRLLGFAEWIAAGRQRDQQSRKAREVSGARRRSPFKLSVALALVELAAHALRGIRVIVGIVAAAIRSAGLAPGLDRYFVMGELLVTMLIGIARDILPEGAAGFDRIDAQDFREWLAHHGARPAVLDCAAVRALYDLGFAYPAGDTTRSTNGRGAAGVALRFLMELFLSYKGAPLWKMNAGMGDVVFTPLYQVLDARGVKFEFFQEAVSIGVGDDKLGVGDIVMRRQARLLKEPYRPFVHVKGLDCWPSKPLWDQLVDGCDLAARGVDFESVWGSPVADEYRLCQGSDFDVAVIAFPPAMIRRVAPELARHSAAWDHMIKHSAAVATQAFQLWLKPTLAELGWSAGPTVLSGYEPPFDTWADMSHLVGREDWYGGIEPKTVAYFCGALQLPDPLPIDPIRPITNDVKGRATQWVAANGSLLWPDVLRRGMQLDPRLLVAEYYRCNIDPSELSRTDAAGQRAIPDGARRGTVS